MTKILDDTRVIYFGLILNNYIYKIYSILGLLIEAIVKWFVHTNTKKETRCNLGFVIYYIWRDEKGASRTILQAHNMFGSRTNS